MRPELVSERKIHDLALGEVQNAGLTGREANDALWVGVRTAHAVLEELGVTKEVEACPGELRLGVEPGEFLAVLVAGDVVLVRAKP